MMGSVEPLRAPTALGSSDDVRAKLAKAEAVFAAATAAWSEKESAERWAVVEDAERTVKQLRLRLAKAERIEAEGRAEAAARALAARRIPIAQAHARIEASSEFVGATVAEVAQIGARLAQIQQAIYVRADACAKDACFIADESRAIGEPAPVVRTEAPLSAVGILRLCQQAVRAARIGAGVSRDVEQNACELVRGSSL